MIKLKKQPFRGNICWSSDQVSRQNFQKIQNKCKITHKQLDNNNNNRMLIYQTMTSERQGYKRTEWTAVPNGRNRNKELCAATEKTMSI